MKPWPRKYAHCSFSFLMQSLLPKDTILRTYLTVRLEPSLNIYVCQLNIVTLKNKVFAYSLTHSLTYSLMPSFYQ